MSTAHKIETASFTCKCNMQAKTLRVLQYFPPPDDPALTESLTETLRRIITGDPLA